MPKGKNLSVKQKTFIKEYIANEGNGTLAALKSYDTDDYATANAIAVENLQKPSIKEAIEQALVKLELTPEWILNKHKTIVETRDDEVMAQERALENIGKIAGLYPSNSTNLELSDGKLKISWEN
ncbi:MAG: terminase small subunit [Acidobacteriota bacterium]|nr:terminase small subunit [Acidobacteriota bacterium]